MMTEVKIEFEIKFKLNILQFLTFNRFCTDKIEQVHICLIFAIQTDKSEIQHEYAIPIRMTAF